MTYARLTERGSRLAGALARARRRALAARLKERAPAGVSVEEDGEGVVLGGRGLARRAMRDPAVRWLVREARDGEG